MVGAGRAERQPVGGGAAVFDGRGAGLDGHRMRVIGDALEQVGQARASLAVIGERRCLGKQRHCGHQPGLAQGRVHEHGPRHPGRRRPEHVHDKEGLAESPSDRRAGPLRQSRIRPEELQAQPRRLSPLERAQAGQQLQPIGHIDRNWQLAKHRALRLPSRRAAQADIERDLTGKELDHPLVSDHRATAERLVLAAEHDEPVARQPCPRGEDRLPVRYVRGAPGERFGQEAHRRERPRRIRLQHAVPAPPRRMERRQDGEQHGVSLVAGEAELPGPAALAGDRRPCRSPRSVRRWRGAADPPTAAAGRSRAWWEKRPASGACASLASRSNSASGTCQ